ncbi:fatty acid desaturase-domain-containing protein [Thamnocephalis sphaerospora]|uniref:Fatty acid desaturase-domain-containing protein n=1 Tax=Thamnocephalis sphaerospora TaxID=78915 RepID=A0A4P9XPL1_9FUNG|nr:fatty acid desaturase-domain-containing protein [Thamnocephalis sphaerospora]|eukprot:RKP07947.1 fatty acid desaturase-domain-containing protein [Thamnocephalis sphaerospora]
MPPPPPPPPPPHRTEDTLQREPSLSPSTLTSSGKQRGVFDRRHPLYLGDWKRSLPAVHEHFARDDLDEPHFKRKRQILREHPEIAQLYGYDTRTLYISASIVFVQVALAWLYGHVLTEHTWSMLAVAYVVGGTAVSLAAVIVHECAHNLAAATPIANRMCSLVTNIIVPIPVAMSFRRYHLEHHTYQGVTGRDPDLPLDWEVRLIRGNPISKLLWVFIYPVMYAVRGLGQGKAMSTWEKYNWVWTICANVLLYRLCGLRGILYLCASAWIGFSLHPGAAHFIQEHYTFVDGQETYSYYGNGNRLWLNIGLHNEHHDFMRVPWSRLPSVRKIASEYYDTLAYHTSWWMVLWRFIVDPTMGALSRVDRTQEKHDLGRRMVREHRQ